MVASAATRDSPPPSIGTFVPLWSRALPTALDPGARPAARRCSMRCSGSSPRWGRCGHAPARRRGGGAAARLDDVLVRVQGAPADGGAGARRRARHRAPARVPRARPRSARATRSGWSVGAILDPAEDPGQTSRGWLLATYALMLEAARRPALRDVTMRWTDAYLEALPPLLAAAGSRDPRSDAELLLAAADGLLVDQLATGDDVGPRSAAAAARGRAGESMSALRTRRPLLARRARRSRAGARSC